MSLIALCREVPASFADSLCMSRPAAPIDVTRARAQHAGYLEVLGRHVQRLVLLPADDALPDCCFVEDAAVVIGRRALSTRPGAPTRRAEVPAVAAALGALGLHPIEMEPPATLDGGDVLACGGTIFVGLSARTDAAGVEWLRRAFPSERVVPLPVEAGLHLKSAVTQIDQGHFLVEDSDAGRRLWQGMAAALPGAQVGWIAEPHGANALRVGRGLLYMAGRPHLRAALERLALDVELCPVDTSELEKADGGLTCLSILIST